MCRIYQRERRRGAVHSCSLPSAITAGPASQPLRQCRAEGLLRAKAKQRHLERTGTSCRFLAPFLPPNNEARCGLDFAEQRNRH
jgi:hypothetical protein